MEISEMKCSTLYNKIECFKTDNLSRNYKCSSLAKQIETICLEEVEHGSLVVNERQVEKFVDAHDGDYWGVKAGVAWLQTKLLERGKGIDVIYDDITPIDKDLELGYFGPCIEFGVAYYNYSIDRIDTAFRRCFGNIKNMEIVNSYITSELVLPKHHDQYEPLFRIMSAVRTQEWLYSFGTVREAISSSCGFDRDFKHLLEKPDGVTRAKNIYLMLYKAAQYIAPSYMEQYIIKDGRPLPKWTLNSLWQYLVSYVLEETKLTKEAKASFIYNHFEDTRSYERVLKQLYRCTSKKYNDTFEKLVDEYLHHQ